MTEGIEFLFKKNKIDWIKGTARLTGSAPRSVPGVEIDRTRIITSDEAIGLAAVPKSIAILGGGAVGVEFASIFRRFGSEVTIFELLPRLVPVEDEAVSAELEKSFRKQSTVDELIRTIHAHPTMAEAVGEAAHAAHGVAIHL